MKKTVKIEGMTCGHCVNHVKEALTEDIQGVNVLDVSLENKCATVEADDNVSNEQIKAVIADLGYTVTSID